MSWRHFPSHMGLFAFYEVRKCMALIRLLTVMCSMLHLWNCLKLGSKGHCWGWPLLPLLIQYHARTLPEGSAPNSSLTLAACRELFSPHYFGFCDLATSATPFQVCPGSLCVRKLPFPDKPQKPFDIRLASLVCLQMCKGEIWGKKCWTGIWG